MSRKPTKIPEIKGQHAQTIDGLLLGLSVFFVLSIFTAQFLSYKIVAVGNYYVMSAATFAVPLWYLLGDVITELYGYKVTRKLIWITILSTIFFSILIEYLISLPSPKNWQYQPYFDYVLGHLVKIAMASFLGILCGGFVNSIILSRWKMLVKGKLYWFRSLLSSMLGQAVYIIIVITIVFYHMVSAKDFFDIMLASFLGKSLMVLIAIGPISFVVRILKVTKKLDAYDYGVNYNPFKI